jgi:uncharacterized membrane protein
MLKNVFLLSAILLIIDMIYLSMITKTYGSMIKDIQGSDMKLRWDSAALTYALIIMQLYYFILHQDKTEYDAFLLGLTTYGVYDFTSYALLKNYKLSTAFVDTCWGGVLYFLTIKIYRLIVE